MAFFVPVFFGIFDIVFILKLFTMKKIYSLVSTLFIGSVLLAQSPANTLLESTSDLIPSAKKIPSKGNLKVTSTGFAGRFDPAYSVMTLNGVQDSEIGGGSTGTKVGMFVTGTNCDSTLTTCFSTTSNYITTHKFGMNFDPIYSIAHDQVGFAPLLTMTETMFLDTVWVGNFYQRVNTINDTLLVEIVWGDSTNTSVYAPFSFAAPSNYMGTFLGPKFNTSSLQGNTSFLTAPALNKKVIKYVLTDADTTVTNNTGYLPIVVNGSAGQLIPAGSIVSAVATFIPGQANIPVGSVAYNPGAGSSPQTVNGMVARLYVQNSPATPVSGSNWFDDVAVGKNHTVYTFKRERYGMSGAFPGLRSSASRAYMMDFSITVPVAQSVKEDMKNNGFSLGQNMPNPFTGSSSVKFALSKEANSAIFTVVDVMGREISKEKVATSIGGHTIQLNNYAAGVYYYSLNVDGKITTKKMIVE